MKIRVTQEHIDRGNIGEHSTCPVALALRDATGEDWSVHSRDAVRLAALVSAHASWAVITSLPPGATSFIRSFDAGDATVAPFEFEFEFVLDGDAPKWQAAA